MCASGKQPAEMLRILDRRLANDPADELLESAAQQQQIMQLRLRKWLTGGCVSRISTHVLDTALGRPAAGIMVYLEQAGPSGEWKALAAHETDGDGRCANLLPQDGANGFTAGVIPAAIRDRQLLYGAIGSGPVPVR